jgi:DNA-binding transcriptional ArsR family regulator
LDKEKNCRNYDDNLTYMHPLFLLYDIFVEMNISAAVYPEGRISKLLSLIGQPVRIQILLAIGAQEACVCHLEAALGVRQAGISQHLMVLRDGGLVTARRDGRNIYYRLVHPDVLLLISQAANLLGINPLEIERLGIFPVKNCPCPLCNPGVDPNLSCQNIQTS